MAGNKNSQERASRDMMKEERAKDAALATKEYEAEAKAVAAKTARLKALRLAQQASAPQKSKTGRLKGN